MTPTLEDLRARMRRTGGSLDLSGNLPRAPGFPFWAAAWAIIVGLIVASALADRVFPAIAQHQLESRDE